MSETNTNPEARVVEAVARAIMPELYGYACDRDPKVIARLAIIAHTKALAAEGMVIVPRAALRWISYSGGPGDA